MAAGYKTKQIEQERGRPMADILRELYDELGNQQAIANELGVTQGTISLWLVRYGLEVKEKKYLVRRRVKPRTPDQKEKQAS